MSDQTPFANRLTWRTTRTMRVAGVEIPVAENLRVSTDERAGWDSAVAGVRPGGRAKNLVKTVLWPIRRVSENVFGHQFLQRPLGRWIRRYADQSTVFLECGPGDMSLRRFLPAGVAYNAIEFAISEFQVRRVLAHDPRVNLAMASIEDIPLADNSVTMVACVEMFMHVPDFEKGLREVVRVCRPGAKVLVTVANGHCTKARVKGPNPHFVHLFTEAAFREAAARAGLHVLEHFQTGLWIPVPQALIGGHSMHVPWRSKREVDNCYFVYLFEVHKG